MNGGVKVVNHNHAYATFLGPPHIVGKPTYILGTPPVQSAPPGYGMSSPLTPGLGMSRMYPGMMGGVPGVTLPHPTTGIPGMMGAVPGVMGLPSPMMGGLPPLSPMMGGLPGMMGGGLGMPSPAMTLATLRRRLGTETEDGTLSSNADNPMALHSLKKCALMLADGHEICVFHDLMTGAVTLEFNAVNAEDMDIAQGIADWNRELTVPEYMEQLQWIWTDVADSGSQCNGELLAVIGYTVCIKKAVDENGRFTLDGMYTEIIDNVNDRPVVRLDFDRENGWSSVYEMMDSDARKLCRYIEGIELCFAESPSVDQVDEIVVTAEYSNSL